ncbi:hypothetical protein [Staphylococcus pseudintermedius]|uniref:hypothetical protein n=1 Tax=Staphylococcus pseudintermedius TaxID=283734 RepID=UPI003F675CF5
MNKVMIFDLDDTLYDQLSGFEYAYYRHFGDTDIGVERLYRHFRLYSEELFEATQTGALSVPDMHVVRITRAVADFDIELPEEKARAVPFNVITNMRNNISNCQLRLLKCCSI